MARTIRRSPLTVSTSSSDYPTLQTFNHVEFKGISSGTNELVVDQSSFADANNIYLDKDYNLVSRPPLKLCTNESGEFEGQIRTWTFGAYRVTYARKIKAASPTETIPGQVSGMRSVYCYSPTASSGFNVRKDRVHEIVIGKTIYTSGSGENKKFYVLENEVAYEVYKAKFVFEFYINGSCLISLSRSIFGTGVNTIPDANCALIGDKIFIWFDGTDLFCYDTAKKELVNAADYIYTPILKQVVNGFESELETKNFLTSAYKKRYQYSTLSDVDFDNLIGEKVEVRLLGDARTDTSAHLYDVTIENEIDKVLLYPYAHVGDDLVDMVSTPRASVFLKYSQGSVSVSFDGKHFNSLPQIALLGKPMLSRDGLLVVGFTEKALVIYRLSGDFVNNAWEEIPYLKKVDWSLLNKPDLSNVVKEPYGYFLDEENFVYVLDLGDGVNDKHLYTERVIDGENKWAHMISNESWPFGGKCKFTIKRGMPNYITYFTDYHSEKPLLCLFKILGFNATGEGFIDGTYLTPYFTHIDIDKYAISLSKLGQDAASVLWVPHKRENEYYLGFYCTENTSGPVTSGGLDRELVFDEDSTLIVSDQLFFGRYLAKKDRTGWIKIPVTGINIQPIYGDGLSVWYLIDGELWTSQRTDDNTLLLDVTIAGENNFSVPDHWRELNEHYFVFNAKETGQNNRLEITQARKSEDGRDLLYLPEYNSQILANKMTNLWPLTDTIMGVFTEKELYYVGAVTADDARISYTKLMKSKTEIGCREGDEIVVSQDGQTLLLPTRRGITAMQASALLDTSAQSLSYLSDPISHIYKEFYDTPVISLALDRISGKSIIYDPAIKITLYGQSILFYKYMAKDILVFDTRNGSWWKWSLPYPIRQLQATDHYGIYSLIAYLQIDFTAHEYGKLIHSEKDGYLPSRLSTLGNMFVFTPEFTHYQDELIPGALLDVDTLSDDFKKIDWHAMSQRLHFGAINNYKCIKSIGLMAKGDGLLELKLQTKAYRDFYHPEYSSLFEFNINEQRTFFKKTNMMHLTNFQYTMSNIDDDDTNIPLSLNSICIKYEVKEAIR